MTSMVSLEECKGAPAQTRSLEFPLGSVPWGHPNSLATPPCLGDARWMQMLLPGPNLGGKLSSKVTSRISFCFFVGVFEA